MNLYEINTAITNCIDTETGEVINFDMLNKLVMQRDEKIENVAKWYKNLDAEAEMLKAEEEKLATRRKVAENKRERAKQYLDNALNGTPFKHGLIEIKYRKSEVVNTLEVDKLAEEYRIIKTMITPNKIKIKQDIKAGIDVKNAELLTKYNIQVK